LAGCASGSPAQPIRDPSGSQGFGRVGPDAFTVIALPDTQYYSARRPEAFEAQTRWIIDHARELNIRAVVGLGDIVDDGSDAKQWANAMRAIEPLKKSGIPFFLAIGNHDYDSAHLERKPLTREVKGFNAHVGPAYYRGLPFYGGSMDASNENFWGTFKAGSRDYLVLSLEFSPRDTALKWAAHVLDTHPKHEAIVIMHSYLYTDDLRVTRCSNHTKRAYGLDADNDGQEVWEKLVSRYPRIRLVLSGHMPEIGVGRRFSLGERGTLVNEILSDYQYEPHEGNGWLRVMTVDRAANRVDVRTYSPYIEAHPEMGARGPWKTDSRNQFSIDLEQGAGGDGAQSGFKEGTIQGVVRSMGERDRCKPVAGAEVRFPGGTATTDVHGHFKAVIRAEALKGRAPYQSVTLEVSKPGWKSAAVRGTVGSGRENAEQVFMVPAAGPAKAATRE
jgi:hypothetical protein